MDDLHRFGVPREPGVIKASGNVVAIYLKNPCLLDKVSSGVAKNYILPCAVDASQGPMRSTATSSNGAPAMS